MSQELVAILDGRETGRVMRDDRGKLSFTYNEPWRTAADAYPLSISMPLALAEHGHAKIDPFLWGLLPDNEIVLDHSAWRIPRDTGQFSLAGTQPKTALLFDNNRWGVPSGRVPTNTILKPPTGEFDGHAENEHFCLELARAGGLPVVDSRIMHFQDEVAIVVERYDRVRTAAGLRRVHQEDMCPALAIPPTRRYQNEGGPGILDIVDLLRTHSADAPEDVRTFLDAIAYNWLIAGADAHGKNYALLIGRCV